MLKDIPQLDGGNDDSESEQVSELEIVKESLDKYISCLDPKTLRNQPAKEVSDSKELSAT